MRLKNLVTMGLGALVMAGTTTAFIGNNYLKNTKPGIENVSEYNQFKKNKVLLNTGIVATGLGVCGLALWYIKEASESERRTYR